MLSQFELNLKDQLQDTETYKWHLDDQFFKEVNGAEIERGSVDVTVVAKRMAERYELSIAYEGTLQVECDRCLEPMQLPVSGEQTLKVKMGEQYDDDGEVVTISEADGTLNVAWNIYEFLALEIPLRHVHPDGECLVETLQALDTLGAEDQLVTDPRWDALRDLNIE